ncbi:MAG: hypothetical protein LBS61_01320 [Endomicrobium sp.]|nr:hypothetical protein [Endomicrobium sp.]
MFNVHKEGKARSAQAACRTFTEHACAQFGHYVKKLYNQGKIEHAYSCAVSSCRT